MIKKSFYTLSLSILIFVSCASDNLSDPVSARLIFQAESAFRSGYYNAALSIADSAISRSPDTPDIHFLRGRVLTKLSRFVEAENAYRDSLVKTLPLRKCMSGVSGLRDIALSAIERAAL
jgi:tetratricopeptide (TPR) repeat protein